MVKITEGWITVQDGTKLYTKTWEVSQSRIFITYSDYSSDRPRPTTSFGFVAAKHFLPGGTQAQCIVLTLHLQPDTRPTANLIFLHGFSDHCESPCHACLHVCSLLSTILPHTRTAALT